MRSRFVGTAATVNGLVVYIKRADCSNAIRWFDATAQTPYVQSALSEWLPSTTIPEVTATNLTLACEIRRRDVSWPMTVRRSFPNIDRPHP